MSTQREFTDEGYTAFEVQVSVSEDYQSVASRLRYEFAQPVDEESLTEPEAAAGDRAQELASQRLAQLLAEKKAKTQGEVERQRKTPPKTGARKRPAPKAEEPAEDTVEWTQVPFPNKKDTLRFRPTSNLSTDALKAMITEAINESGADPELHVVYDERIGQYGLEKKGKGYRFATVKPTEDNPAYDYMLETSSKGKEYAKASFYVDFDEDDGTVRVKPSKEYQQAIKDYRAEDSLEEEEPEEEMPF